MATAFVPTMFSLDLTSSWRKLNTSDKFLPIRGASCPCRLSATSSHTLALRASAADVPISDFKFDNSSVSEPDATEEYDAIIIGSGIGALTTAGYLASKGGKVLVLEKYLVPGGSSAYYKRNGYTFDVGASMIFGLGQKGYTNLLTRMLKTVNQSIETIPDPVQVNYHLPNNINIRIFKDYDRYIQHLGTIFPHERDGLKKFYDECWNVFNALNAMELLSLEEPRYLLRVFFQQPIACLTLLRYIGFNTSKFARKYIKDPIVLNFIDVETYIFSVCKANLTPMINSGMVFSDRHYAGINYPKGGVGQIALKMVEGIESLGSKVKYGINVSKIIIRDGKAVGVKTAGNGKIYRGKTVISNATRWDTFGKLVPEDQTPPLEKQFREKYVKTPSFLSLHIGVDKAVIQQEEDCHHILLDEWDKMTLANDAEGTVFVSIPSLLDPTLAPPDKHILHVFTASYIEEWQNLSISQYEKKKESCARKILSRLSAVFPKLADQTCIDFMEVGTPRTHRRYLGRAKGTYGPMPSDKVNGLLTMPFNRTEIENLYCVGDSCFPGQGLNAVAFSGFACGHRVAVDLKLLQSMPKVIDDGLSSFLGKTRLKIF